MHVHERSNPLVAAVDQVNTRIGRGTLLPATVIAGRDRPIGQKAQLDKGDILNQAPSVQVVRMVISQLMADPCVRISRSVSPAKLTFLPTITLAENEYLRLLDKYSILRNGKPQFFKARMLSYAFADRRNEKRRDRCEGLLREVRQLAGLDTGVSENKLRCLVDDDFMIAWVIC